MYKDKQIVDWETVRGRCIEWIFARGLLRFKDLACISFSLSYTGTNGRVLDANLNIGKLMRRLGQMQLVLTRKQEAVRKWVLATVS